MDDSMDVEVWMEEVDDFDEPSPSADAAYYEVIRESLAPEFHDCSDEEIDDLVEQVLETMSPEEAEGFSSTVGNLAMKAAPVAAPIAGTVVGTAIGGPVGGVIGAKAGQLAGQSLAPQEPMGEPPEPGAPPAPAQAPVPTGGTSAAAQLLALLQNPAMLRSILAYLMGSAGRRSERVGRQGKSAPFGAFMNALSALATQAAVDANAQMAQTGAQETPQYLLDAEGNFTCDPAVPEQRAQVLLEALREDFFADVDDEEDLDDEEEYDDGAEEDYDDSEEYAGGAEEEDDDEEYGDDEADDELTEWFVDAGLVERRPHFRGRFGRGRRNRRRGRRPHLRRKHRRGTPRHRLGMQRSGPRRAQFRSGLRHPRPGGGERPRRGVRGQRHSPGGARPRGGDHRQSSQQSPCLRDCHRRCNRHKSYRERRACRQNCQSRCRGLALVGQQAF